MDRQKVNSLLRRDNTHNQGILHRMVQQVSQNNLKFSQISLFKSFAKNKTKIPVKVAGLSMIFCYTELHLSK